MSIRTTSCEAKLMGRLIENDSFLEWVYTSRQNSYGGSRGMWQQQGVLH